MSEHVSELNIERYRKRVMASEELFATSFHLAICDVCQERFAGDDILEPTHAFIRDELRAAQNEKLELDHIDSRAMAAYVNETIDWPEREIVETHREICAQCAAAADKLRLSAATAEAVPPLKSPPLRVSSRDRSRMTQPAWRIPIWIAAAGLAAALIWFGTLPLRARVGALQDQVDQLRKTNEALNWDIAAQEGLQAQLEEYRRENERLSREIKASQDAISRLENERAPKQAGFPIRQRLSSQPFVSLNDESGSVSLDERGNITGISALPVSYQTLIRKSLTFARLQTPPLIAKLRGKPSKTMGNAAGPIPFLLLAPAGTAIESESPIFRWQPLNEATGYTVTLLDSRGNRVETSPLLLKNEWQIPSRLTRGSVYYWQVKAIRGGIEVVSPSGVAPDVGFIVLRQTQVDELQRAREKFSNSHLALGVIYAHVGLLDEAQKEIEALARANPSSPVVQGLLRSLQSLRR